MRCIDTSYACMSSETPRREHILGMVNAPQMPTNKDDVERAFSRAGIDASDSYSSSDSGSGTRRGIESTSASNVDIVSALRKAA